MSRRVHRIAAIAAAGVVALSAGGLAACGDDDSEGPAEEAGKAVDEAGKEAGKELKEAGKEAEHEIDDGTRD